MTILVKATEFAAKNVVAIATAIAAAVGGYVAGKKGVFDRKSTTKKRTTKKRGNSKKASGNRKAKAKAAVKKTVRKVTKKSAIGEKAEALNS